jgi:hypothetical protein
VLVRDARAAHEQRQQRAGVQANDEPLEAELRERGRRREDHLGLDRRRGRPQHVDVALHELTKAAVLGTFRAPDGSDLVALEDGGQRAATARSGSAPRLSTRNMSFSFSPPPLPRKTWRFSMAGVSMPSNPNDS